MSEFVTLATPREMELEYAWVGPAELAKKSPVMVFLHEGLGSLTLWRGFPQALCERLQWRGLVYSRYGYGASTPHGEAVPEDYLEREALESLPAVLEALGIERPWLLGHSDGGSIALIAAGDGATRSRYAGIVSIAPHYCVEEVCLQGIERARDAYEHGALRARLAKYHRDVDSVFYGWCDTWLNPARRGWNIEAFLKNIVCPVLAIQGVQDEYATLDQIRAIKRCAPQTQLMEVADCGHFPFLKHPEKVIEGIAAFVGSGNSSNEKKISSNEKNFLSNEKSFLSNENPEP